MHGKETGAWNGIFIFLFKIGLSNNDKNEKLKLWMIYKPGENRKEYLKNEGICCTIVTRLLYDNNTKGQWNK